MEDPNKRPSAQELAHGVGERLSDEENEIEISRQKMAFRKAMQDAFEDKNISPTLCDECWMPAVPCFFHCNICCDGNFDLCESCFASGVRCNDNNHQLLKRRLGPSGNIVEEF